VTPATSAHNWKVTCPIHQHWVKPPFASKTFLKYLHAEASSVVVFPRLTFLVTRLPSGGVIYRLPFDQLQIIFSSCAMINVLDSGSQSIFTFLPYKPKHCQFLPTKIANDNCKNFSLPTVKKQ